MEITKKNINKTRSVGMHLDFIYKHIEIERKKNGWLENNTLQSGESIDGLIY